MVFDNMYQQLNPCVSVIMAVYNGERYLKYAIQSILNQSFNDFEVIIINDGSTDTSSSILEEYKAKDKRIITINRKKQGLSKSLNEGIYLSRGKFIARQDADDISYKKRIEKQVHFLDEHSEYGLVGTKVDYIDEFGYKLLIENKYFYENYENIKQNIVRFNPFCHSSVMFRREVCNKVGIYDEKLKYAQDYEFWIRIMAKYKVANLNEILVHKRVHKKAISTANIKKQIYYSVKIKIFAMRHLSLPFYNYLSVIDAISGFIFPISFSKRIEKIKILIRDWILEILLKK